MTTLANATAAQSVLALEQIGEGRYRSLHNQGNYSGTIFGGQTIGQSLAAAQRTVPGWPVHTCNGYFLRGGVPDQPIDYQVDVLRDGRKFAARQVTASQGGRAIFELLCAFHDTETGLEHQTAIQNIPDPEDLISAREYVRNHTGQIASDVVEAFLHDFPVEIRPVDPNEVFFRRSGQLQRDYWFRMESAAAIADPRDHHCLLAFMSDFWFAGVAVGAHWPPTPQTGVSVASLNHSLWFHGPVRVDEWVLARTESPWSGEGRGLSRGLFYNLDGKLIATAVQEIAIRVG
jgi:acyl-CoA thioesterase-2